MDTQKGPITRFGEWWDEKQAQRRQASTTRPSSRSTTWLPSRGNVIFTLVMIGLLVLAQSVGALPLGRLSSAPAATSTGTIAYQGRLADSAGAPLTGTYNMIFRLYDAAASGTPLWEEQWIGPNGVRVSDGLFNVMLGSLTAMSQSVIAGHDQLFLGITVGTDDEMAPRVQLGSVPFAVQALTVPDGSVTTAKIADEAVTQAKLATDVSVVPLDGSITTAKIADGAVTTSKLADKAITTTKLASGTVLNRYYVEWFGDETPCVATSTSWVECGATLGYGFVAQFPPPSVGSVRQYRLMVANSDDLTTSGSSILRVYRSDNGNTVYEYDLRVKWARADYQMWQFSSPITFSEATHLEMQIRLTQSGHSLWLYRVWVMAEDVVP